MGTSLVYTSSIFSVELAFFTLGIKGGSTSLRYNASQSISLNQGWFWISSKPLWPNRFDGFRSSNFEHKSNASGEIYCDSGKGASKILRYLEIRNAFQTYTFLSYWNHQMVIDLLTFHKLQYLMTTNPHTFHMTKMNYKS